MARQAKIDQHKAKVKGEKKSVFQSGRRGSGATVKLRKKV